MDGALQGSEKSDSGVSKRHVLTDRVASSSSEHIGTPTAESELGSNGPMSLVALDLCVIEGWVTSYVALKKTISNQLDRPPMGHRVS